MSRTFTHIKSPTQWLGMATAYTVLLALFFAVAGIVAYVAHYTQAAQLFSGIFLVCLVVGILLIVAEECLNEMRKANGEPAPLSREEKRYIVQEVRKAHEGDANLPQMRGVGLAAPQPGRTKPAPTSQVVIGHPIRKHPD